MFIWNWSIVILLVTAVWLYVRGWRLQPGQGSSLLPAHWRALSFCGALLILGVALFSPIHRFATQYFSLHVLQRLLLVAVTPSLLLSGNPLPIMYAGLPFQVQEGLRRAPDHAPKLTRLLILSSRPVPIWFLFVSTFWLWHDGQIARLSLEVAWIHRLENITLLGTAVAYWWHIMGASPRFYPAMPLLWRVGYAALGATPVKLVGLVLMFTSTAVYQYPAEISYYNLEITDESLGAALVWAVGGIVFTWTAVLLMRNWLQDEDEKPALPESVWSSEEMMLAPGFGKTTPFSPPSK